MALTKEWQPRPLSELSEKERAQVLQQLIEAEAITQAQALRILGLLK